MAFKSNWQLAITEKSLPLFEEGGLPVASSRLPVAVAHVISGTSS
jgi:hypothetical protein